MNTDKYMNEINHLRGVFENFKEEVVSEKIPCYFAEDKFIKLKRMEKRLRTILLIMNADDDVINEINLLINETEQFLHDIQDINDIDKKRF